MADWEPACALFQKSSSDNQYVAAVETEQVLRLASLAAESLPCSAFFGFRWNISYLCIGSIAGALANLPICHQNQKLYQFLAAFLALCSSII